LFLADLCAAWIALGSLYPFSGWREMADWSPAFLSAPLPKYITRTDVATNLLLYLPIGYALSLYSAGRIGAIWPSSPTALGVLFSLTLESLQQLLPGRYRLESG
jgi:VanZ family protein